MSKRLYVGAAAVSFLIAVSPSLARAVHRRVIARALSSTGRILGSAPHGRAEIVEFADYQCPACAMADSVMTEYFAGRRAPSIAYHHYPLEANHPLAFEAAVAVECASEQGVFERLHHAMFRRQEDFGRVTWLDLARGAGLKDSVAFRTCMDGNDAADRVVADIREGNRLHLTGTPAFLIDGEMYYGVLSDSVLSRFRN